MHPFCFGYNMICKKRKNERGKTEKEWTKREKGSILKLYYSRGVPKCRNCM